VRQLDEKKTAVFSSV